MQEVDLNWIAIFVAAIVPMVLGALWYSNALFARPWMRAVDRTEDELKGAGMGYVLSAIGAVLMSYALARLVRWAEVDDLWNGALVGLLVWVGFVATVVGVALEWRAPARTAPGALLRFLSVAVPLQTTAPVRVPTNCAEIVKRAATWRVSSTSSSRSSVPVSTKSVAMRDSSPDTLVKSERARTSWPRCVATMARGLIAQRWY